MLWLFSQKTGVWTVFPWGRDYPGRFVRCLGLLQPQGSLAVVGPGVSCCPVSGRLFISPGIISKVKVALLRITPDSEELIASGARVCYASEPKNPDANVKLLRNLREWGHMSAFEHASATFLVEGVSRACTHQLVRHRIASYN